MHLHMQLEVCKRTEYNLPPNFHAIRVAYSAMIYINYTVFRLVTVFMIPFLNRFLRSPAVQKPHKKVSISRYGNVLPNYR